MTGPHARVVKDHLIFHPSQPENLVYSGPSTAPLKRVTLRTLRQKYAAKEPISMCTAYDYPLAVHVRASRMT